MARKLVGANGKMVVVLQLSILERLLLATLLCNTKFSNCLDDSVTSNSVIF